MTCASCANRIERKLNKLDGVTATVNYATEKAKVSFPVTVSTDDLLRDRRGRGLRRRAADAARRGRRGRAASATRCCSGCSSAPPSASPSSRWRWCRPGSSPTGSGPRSPWPPPSSCGARGPSTARRWTNLRHGATTMDTLVSVGVLAAFGWSLWALFLGTAGEPGMTHPFRALDRPHRRRGQHLPRGRRRGDDVPPRRPLARAPLQAAAGAALRALLELGARDVAVLRDGHETRIPVDQLAVGDLFVVRPGEKVATDGEVVEGSLRGRRLDAHR